ncbi:MBL fold metallo-hydrolase [Polaromonas sp. CG_9.11]|uniref:MBL fold metallo-hydrolase n=1 Tax=Polaromonas sp. CG_9.11 TaxID=2787730 RepID=UPI0018CA5F88|nr:MBL fold metallo-hydrolase [Polaromonas sp. CG_9.11]
MMRFRSLGSGSGGNATLVEAGGLLPFRLLVDCGLGIRQLAVRLGQAGLQAEDIDAVFITHEHGDHIGCAHTLALRYRIPVWMSQGTHSAIGSPDFDGLLHIARDAKAIDMGGLQLMPFTVPHDAREPLQLSCTDGSSKLGILTDLGHATPHVMAHLQACHALLLESNHDTDLLDQSVYPPFLKRRVGGDYGHLSNMAAAAIANAVNHGGLKHVVAAHLSAKNNRPDLVQEVLSNALGCQPGDIVVAGPSSGTPWMQL